MRNTPEKPIATIPRYTQKGLERSARRLIEAVAPKVLSKPTPTPVVEILDRLVEKLGVSFAYRDLGKTPAGNQLLGLFCFEPWVILLDDALVDDDPRFPFVLAHEIGHLILHRDLPVEVRKVRAFVDTERELALRDRSDIPDRTWLEWHANQFASSLLMPDPPFSKALEAVQRSLGITKNLGRVYVDENSYSQDEFKRTVLLLAETFNVNMTNVRHRLSTLDLVDDKRRGGWVSDLEL